jgi:trehalose/maltose hydrolase-like predicted phosphorylase
MKWTEFEQLPMQQQVSLLYTGGVYIGKRKHCDLTLILFQLEGFYVEVCYAKYRHDISWLQCSDSTVLLDPYLEQIDVEYLV